MGLALVAFGVGGYLAWWYGGRTEAVDRDLYRGVRYIRTVSESPRAVIAHLVLVNLSEGGVTFQVTPADTEIRPKVRAATVEEFLKSSGMQVAMNANFFHPFHSRSPWDFYPRAGDAVEVLGIAASQGEVYSTQLWANATVYFSPSNKVQFGGGVERVWNAISGDQWLIREGVVVAKEDAFGIYPRAATALNEGGDTFILAAVDGKQPGYSEGMTLPELAKFLKGRGAHNAVNLDGGGSVTLVAQGADGKPVVLNSPIHTRIPGSQRPVANHIGIRAPEVEGR